MGDPNSVHTRRWLAYFVERGHEVHLLGELGVPIRELDERIQVHHYALHGQLRLPGLSVLQTRRDLRQLLHRLQPDLLHAHFVRRYAWRAWVSGFHPLVVTPWGSDLLLPPKRNLRTRWWNHQALRGADVVTVVSDAMRAMVISGGAHPNRIRNIQFGVDTRRFSPGAPDPDLLRGLGLSERQLVFSPRAIRPLYRHEVVLAAFASLPGETMLVMSGRNADREYLARLRQQMAELGTTDRVRVIDDIADDDLLGLYRVASVVVSVPTSDGMPITLLEAMACGTPVVAGDLPPVRALLGQIAPNSLVVGDDPAAVAAALNHALSLTDAQHKALSSAMREHVVRTADYETNMARMEQIYRELVTN